MLLQAMSLSFGREWMTRAVSGSKMPITASASWQALMISSSVVQTCSSTSQTPRRGVLLETDAVLVIE